ncbi:MAG: NirD/YgiW/YdeI family stress tolerance protein [Endozoicomonas sp.]
MTKKQLWTLVTLTILLILALLAFPEGSENTPPLPAKKPIPSEQKQYHKASINDILEHSEDLELVKLSGEFIQKVRCNTYLFRDDTGEIKVFIDDDLIPFQGIPFNLPVMLKGEVEKSSLWPIQVDVDNIRYVF